MPLGLHFFAGVSCWYGDEKSLKIYTRSGLGAEYRLKPSEPVAISIDFALDEGDNLGF